MSVHANARKVTTHTLQEMKRAGEKITMLTAYDFSLAKLVTEVESTEYWSETRHLTPWRKGHNCTNES